MSKIDLKVTLKELYRPSRTAPVVLEVPCMEFLMIDGKGDPNKSSEFEAAVQSLFSVAYTLKFIIKKHAEIDYAVMPLEGLWWAEDMRAFSFQDKSQWLWTLMILQPKAVSYDLLEEAKAKAAKKAPLLDRLRYASFEEGSAVQIMYIGPYSKEGPTIQRLHEHIAQVGGELQGKHHEIYLSDMRRTAPEKLKTIIRQPFRKAV